MRVKLGDVCERGTSNLKLSDVSEKNGEFSVFGASGYIGSVDFYQQGYPYVAVVKDGAGIGRAMLCPGKTSVIGTMQYLLHRVRCNHQIILPDYLAWWFRYNCDYGGFSALAGAKATIAHLPGAKLKQLQVAVPPMELQEQFAVFVAQTDKSKVAVRKY